MANEEGELFLKALVELRQEMDEFRAEMFQGFSSVQQELGALKALITGCCVDIKELSLEMSKRNADFRRQLDDLTKK